MKKIIIGIIILISISFIWQAKSANTLPVSKVSPLSAELEIKTENNQPLNWAEYKSVIEKYNSKLDEIKKNCSLDKRCQDGKVNFGAIKDKRDFVKIINKWLKEADNKNYGK